MYTHIRDWGNTCHDLLGVQAAGSDTLLGCEPYVLLIPPEGARA